MQTRARKRVGLRGDRSPLAGPLPGDRGPALLVLNRRRRLSRDRRGWLLLLGTVPLGAGSVVPSTSPAATRASRGSARSPVLARSLAPVGALCRPGPDFRPVFRVTRLPGSSGEPLLLGLTVVRRLLTGLLGLTRLGSGCSLTSSRSLAGLLLLRRGLRGNLGLGLGLLLRDTALFLRPLLCLLLLPLLPLLDFLLARSRVDRPRATEGIRLRLAGGRGGRRISRVGDGALRQVQLGSDGRSRRRRSGRRRSLASVARLRGGNASRIRSHAVSPRRVPLGGTGDPFGLVAEFSEGGPGPILAAFAPGWRLATVPHRANAGIVSGTAALAGHGRRLRSNGRERPFTLPVPKVSYAAAVVHRVTRDTGSVASPGRKIRQWTFSGPIAQITRRLGATSRC